MAATDYDAAVLADSPSAYFKMRDTSGTVLSETIGGNPAFNLTGTYTLNQTGPASDVAAISFTNGKATPASGGITLPTTGTIEVWAKITTLTSGGYSCIFAKDSTDDGLFALGVSSNTTFKPNLFFTTDHVPSAAISDGAWHHIAIPISAGAGTFYVDGGIVTGSFSGWTSKVLDTIASDSSAETLKGLLSGLAVYSTALSGARILAHYNAMLTAPAVAGRSSGIGIGLGLNL